MGTTNDNDRGQAAELCGSKAGIGEFALLMQQTPITKCKVDLGIGCDAGEQ